MYFRIGGRDERTRYQYNYRTVQQYLSIKCEKKEIADFFRDRGYRKIAIYGMGELGKCVLNDLKDSDIEISYIVDQAYNNFPQGIEGISVIGRDIISQQEEVDIMVVTVLYEFNQIVDALAEQIELEKIINLSDVVYSL